MSQWSRFANLFRGGRAEREIDEELQSHLAEAAERGRDPVEARRAFGSPLARREESRDVRLIPWLDSLRRDAVFGWRRVLKTKVTSAAAVLSLALGMGACTAAFRLIDALLLRPLPVSDPDRLYTVAFENIGADGRLATYDSSSYPMFRRMREVVKGDAELIGVSYTDHAYLTYGSDEEMEKVNREYVSGWMFGAFGLRPALGRLLTEADDGRPGASAVAVLSHDYWARRFGRDRGVIGRTFRLGDDLFEIVGVADERFTGTETGFVTDVFLPMAMKTARTLASPDNFWLRTLVKLRPGVNPGPVHEKLAATFQAIQQERAKGFTAMPKDRLEAFFKERLLLERAAAGRSNLQRDYRRPLVSLAVMVALVLLIACANVANLMTARAASRAREMALRVSIGAGRRRLLQLVLIESAWLALLATVLAVAFAWRAAPWIAGMINPPDDPARLVLPADWRVAGFTLVLALLVTLFFGLLPAFRASGIQPVLALRGGEDPHSKRRLMQTLIAVQAAFCFVVLLAAGLFAASFERLLNRPLGFSPERIVNLETVARHAQPAVAWDQVADHLRQLPGVERVALTVWPLMSGEAAIGNISVNGAAPSGMYSDFLNVSPGWLETMRIPLIDGRDFRDDDVGPGVAIVNQAFAKQFLNGGNPLGLWFERLDNRGLRRRMQIVGFVPDARSRDDVRLPIRPTAYLPFHTADGAGIAQPVGRGTFVVRTAGANPLALASMLRREIPRTRPELYVSGIRAQSEIDGARLVRERLLALLAVFFGGVALVLASVGLYGVLDYSVLQRRREIGIRMAIGARAPDVAASVTAGVFVMVAVGVMVGVGLGMAAVRLIQSLFFEVKATDPVMLILPGAAILVSALLAALPAAIRAVRIDPISALRSD